MTCQAQCKNCMESVSVADKFIGRHILCPMCDTRLKIEPPDPNQVFLKQDFLEALARFKLSDWDRAVARKAFELEMADAKKLRRAIRSVRLKARKGAEVVLNEELLATGAIEKASNLALCELVKGSEAAPEEKLTECPNCFGSIPATAEICKFCGQQLGDLLLMDMCPNCKREQPEGQKLCRSCGADMATGLKPGVHVPRCPRCGQAIQQDARICPQCHTNLDRYRREKGIMRHVVAAKDWLSANAFFIFCGVALLVAVCVSRNWGKIRYEINARIETPARAALYERVRNMDKALEFDDLKGIGKLLDPKLRHQPSEKTRTCILGGENLDAVVEKLDAPLPHDYEFGDGDQTATVYTVTHGMFDLSTVTVSRLEDAKDFQKAIKDLSTKSARILSARVAWKWARRKGEWYYLGPLPGKDGKRREKK